MEEEVCPICGLPKSLCVCKTIEKETKKIKIYYQARNRHKGMTIIEGLDEIQNVKEFVKELKSSLSCGGSFKEGKIILQGDQRKKVKDYLIKQGYREDQIDLV